MGAVTSGLVISDLLVLAPAAYSYLGASSSNYNDCRSEEDSRNVASFLLAFSCRRVRDASNLIPLNSK